MDVPVSVIIPCYRCCKTIKRTVESVAQQIDRPSEVLLIEDGSLDQTLSVLKYLETLYPKNWLKVIPLNQNCGVSVARNVGWEQANQPYITFLDADDIWHPQKIEFQYRWMLDHSHVSGTGHGHNLDQTLPTVYHSLSSQFTFYQVKKRDILRMNPCVTPSVMLKREIPLRFDPQKRYCEDYLLWQTIIFEGYEFYYLDFIGTFILDRPQSLSKNKNQMRIEDLKNYMFLWQTQKINLWVLLGCILYSCLKHVSYMINPHTHRFVRNKFKNRKLNHNEPF